MVGENAGVDQRCKSTVATRGADSDQVLVCSPAAIVRSWPIAAAGETGCDPWQPVGSGSIRLGRAFCICST